LFEEIKRFSCHEKVLKGTQAWDFTPLFWHKLMSGILLVVCVHFFENFFTIWGVILSLILSTLSGSAQSEVNLTLRRPGRRTTLLHVNLDDGRPCSALTRATVGEYSALPCSTEDFRWKSSHHSANTRTTDDLTLHRPGRRTTSLCADPDGAEWHKTVDTSAPSHECSQNRRHDRPLASRTWDYAKKNGCKISRLCTFKSFILQKQLLTVRSVRTKMLDFHYCSA